MTMKALSVKNPWAWALVTKIEGSTNGDKIVENRTWKHPHRGPLLIVSSMKGGHRREYELVEWITEVEIDELKEQTLQYPSRFRDPYMQGGMILGVVDMVACLELKEFEQGLTYAAMKHIAPQLAMKMIDQGHIFVGNLPRTESRWATGPYCHVYANVRRLPPVKAMGRLGMYDMATVGGEPIARWIERDGVFVR